MPTKIEKDSVTGTETTGHEWDGVKELNTPLPKWWLYVLYATIAWAVGYMALYPSWPSLSRHYDGLLRYSTRAESAQRVAAQAEQRSPFMRRIAIASLAEIQAAPDLFNFSLAAGRAAFADNCAPCHGSGGGGSADVPGGADCAEQPERQPELDAPHPRTISLKWNI